MFGDKPTVANFRDYMRAGEYEFATVDLDGKECTVFRLTGNFRWSEAVRGTDLPIDTCVLLHARKDLHLHTAKVGKPRWWQFWK
jgi:hypothetical protein